MDFWRQYLALWDAKKLFHLTLMKCSLDWESGLIYMLLKQMSSFRPNHSEELQLDSNPVIKLLVSIGTGLQAGWLRCLSSPKSLDWLWDPLSLLFSGYLNSFPGVRQPRCEVLHLPPSSAEVKNWCSCASTNPYGILVQGQFYLVWNYLK